MFQSLNDCENLGKSLMKCSIFRSSIKGFTYIYLSDESEYEDLPVSLRNVFGEPELVMKLDLTPDRKLANEDTNEVLKNLAEQGYHLQLPPLEDPTGLLDLPGEKETLL